MESFLSNPFQDSLVLPPLTKDQRYLIHKRCEQIDKHMTHNSIGNLMTLKRHQAIVRPRGTDLRFKLIRALIEKEKNFSKHCKSEMKKVDRKSHDSSLLLVGSLNCD